MHAGSKTENAARNDGWAMQKSSVLTIGLLFHILYIMTVFDCYFTSPVVHGMQHFKAGNAEAKRLVLFVGDGLRADLLFNQKPFPNVANSPDIVAPYLHEIARERGAFGISHTHVPTESRPGHVALIAGMYEDVSAVTKGWKTNPLDFDSVFNQSSHTFSFGSPDILPMFARGASSEKVKTWSYNEEEEDFTRDATELDTWVLDQLQLLLRNASSDVQLNAQVRGEQTVFFLHLLGLDTTGHSYRPHSSEYMRNIQVVDDIVMRAEKLFKDFFHDDKTAFVFTADHGMSNIGNHGDGHPDNTRTPLIAWGAGVRGPLPLQTPSNDSYSSSWPTELRSLVRHDVEQADIAALMAALLGINFPANSVGVLPDVKADESGYLSLSDGEEGRARLAIVNAKSILEQYRVKHRIKSAQKLLYKPYPALASQDKSGDPGSSHLLLIEHQFASGKWAEARKESADLIRVTLEGLRYLQTYDRYMLQQIVFLGYLGWCTFSATSIFLQPISIQSQRSPRARLAIIASATAVLAAFYTVFILQKEPLTYYLYVAFPCFFWCQTLLRLVEHGVTIVPSGRRLVGKQTANKRFSYSPLDNRAIRICLVAFISLQCMVAAYRVRSIWSIMLAFGGLVWPSMSWPKRLNIDHPTLRVKWAFACLVCAIFPLRNVEQSEDALTVSTGGIAMVLAGGACMRELRKRGQLANRVPPLVQLGLTVLSIGVTADSIRRLSAKSGLPLSSQVAGWTILVISVCLPILTPYRSLHPSAKLLTLFLAFTPCFVILSICAEGLFYLSYCMTLIVWVDVETKLRHAVEMEKLAYLEENEAKTKVAKNANDAASEQRYTPRSDDIRIAVFFLFFVQVAFFGTGNVASISSFYLEPVYRLIPIFSPFAMAALLIFKIIAPYVMLSAAFALLNARLHMPPFSLFMIALSMTDGMTITFFLSVTDAGSWLEIGQTISFFVIASLLLVWAAGICALGEWLMRPANATPLNTSSNTYRLRSKAKAE